ncbi:hypothetical protein CEXT_791521 [Caerostris extrusa]|uniref:Uncharacterized protein n=1 Tax=Caerostris extrusa TaxID=172846 RepID=A0AAV4XAY6_CAEEX|nr:hypothetical protein CEXT_791521 [Caerostris extrusa]
MASIVVNGEQKNVAGVAEGYVSVLEREWNEIRRGMLEKTHLGITMMDSVTVNSGIAERRIRDHRHHRIDRLRPSRGGDAWGWPLRNGRVELLQPGSRLRCIPLNKFCDGIRNCPDGSDEPPECTSKFNPFDPFLNVIATIGDDQNNPDLICVRLINV